MSNEHGSLSTSSYMNVEQQNDSANENETIDDQSVASNTMNASKYHSNMSDITNIQMRLDNIQVIYLNELTKMFQFKAQILIGESHFVIYY